MEEDGIEKNFLAEQSAHLEAMTKVRSPSQRAGMVSDENSGEAASDAQSHIWMFDREHSEPG